MKEGVRWTTEEVKMLYTNIPTPELAEMLGRSEKAVRIMRTAICAVPHDALRIPEAASAQEKEARIYALAQKLGVRIQ